MRAYAVIDIGGTAIKYGCATEEGQFLEKASRPTRAGAVSIPDAVLAIVKDMAARHELAGIAIDTAGIVRPGEDGEIVFAGTPREMIDHGQTITAEYLRRSMVKIDDTPGG